MFLHTFVSTWFLRVFSRGQGASSQPPVGPAASADAGDGPCTKETRLTRGVCAATNVGIGLGVLHSVFGKPAFLRTPSTPSNTSSDTESDLDDISYSTSSSPSSQSQRSLSPDSEDQFLRTPEPYQEVDDFQPQEANCGAFQFAGFSNALNENSVADELQLIFPTATGSPTNRRTVLPLTRSNLRLLSNARLDSWFCNDLVSPDDLDVDALEAISLGPVSWPHDDRALGSSGSIDPFAISACSSSQTSSFTSGVSLYSETAEDVYEIESQLSISWSSVPRRAPSIVTTTLTTPGATAYAESEYVMGCHPPAPAHLVHGDSLFVLRWLHGRGSFGRVLAAHDRVGQLVAIKVVHKDKQYREDTGRAALLREKAAMERAAETRSRFVCPLLEAFADADNVHFVMPFYPETLCDVIQRGPLAPKLVRLYFAEMLLGLKALHAAGILHRDLKPDNVLVGRDGHVALADFGLAYLSSEPLWNTRVYGAVGTVGYLAPEVYDSDYGSPEQQACGYSEPADVFSLAIVVFEAAKGELQHFVRRNQQTGEILYLRNLRLPMPHTFSDPVRHVLAPMIAQNPKHRPTLAMIQRHQYFYGVDWTLLRQGIVAGDALPDELYRPAFPVRPAGECDTSLRFTDFHRGCDSTVGPLQPEDIEDEQLVPNEHVIAQRADDVVDYDAFEYPPLAPADSHSDAAPFVPVPF
ncbi:serine/threonine-protein kinase [Phanerochaete sordida]|uniref:non-specific serine/threonine protein kinase n=1 Tax=Phanerochaete sordida TaxID=48140 RepID=A0A9P3LB42_9APHY|nr:serine/threonine-protein kinase [Phanerochaete sordida]